MIIMMMRMVDLGDNQLRSPGQSHRDRWISRGVHRRHHYDVHQLQIGVLDLHFVLHYVTDRMIHNRRWLGQKRGEDPLCLMGVELLVRSSTLSLRVISSKPEMVRDLSVGYFCLLQIR